MSANASSSTRRLDTISLGAGVQSTTMALLAAEGVLPKPDAAIFADTGWEPAAVYETVDRLEQTLAAAGIPLYRVRRGGNIREDVLDRHVFATLPAYTVTDIEVREPLTWHLHDCVWAQFHKAGVPIAQIENIPADHDGDTVTELLAIADAEEASEPDALAESDLRAVVGALEAASLDQVPARCTACHFGREVTSWHTYTRQVKGTIRRQCTGKYKIEPVEKQNRILLGAPVWTEPCRYCLATGTRLAPWDPNAGPGRCSVCRGSGARRRVGSVPDGARVVQWIGFSTDEIQRVTTNGFPSYATPRFPLIDLGMSRDDCATFLQQRGWTRVAKSACVGCPFHRNAFWRDMRDTRPGEWADAVVFDRAFRHAPGLNARRYLHESCLPLDQAPIDRLTRNERTAAQTNLLELIVVGGTAERSCSPYGCPSSEVQAA